MTWLEKLVPEMLANLPRPVFAPHLIFGFDHVQKAIVMIEGAIDLQRGEAIAAVASASIAAAQDPHHNWVKNPVIAPAAVALRNAEMTFPLILRRSLFIAICSHVEYALRRWCEMLHQEWSLPRDLDHFTKTPPREADLHHCMRYIRDEAGLALGDFEQWTEWVYIDACRLARNRLAHNGGIIQPADPPKLQVLAQVQVSGFLQDHPGIHLLPGACEAANGMAKTFFERLVTACQNDPRVKASASP
jgi:hypothetical protein